jgi:ABC-2 type transport system ATP-binding protein
MAQQFSMYNELTVVENLTFFSEMYDVGKDEFQERMQRLLGFAGLTEFKSRRAAHLSGGMQKKLALACTLIHQPELLLLDEPTTGVDPVSRREFWNILTELNLEGTTIVVSTPYMDEADRCSRVGLMYEGRLIICANPREIRKEIGGEMIELIPKDWRKAYDFIKTMPGVHELQTYGELLHVIVDSAEKRLPKIRKALKKQGIGFKGLRVAPARMEEAFISLVRRLEE